MLQTEQSTAKYPCILRAAAQQYVRFNWLVGNIPTCLLEGSTHKDLQSPPDPALRLNDWRGSCVVDRYQAAGKKDAACPYPIPLCISL